MDESETKTCTNCKREIPAVNFTIHAVHCARNIKVCPVCKEPVLQAELQEHHEKFHKLLPCKKCGESVCGTDLEDHIRDSCAHTIKSCRFCELELPRRELPSHEGYCGARTEQCPECREWVMLKYRQLHRDSNHGFLRLDDDPVPQKPYVGMPVPNIPLPRLPVPLYEPRPPGAVRGRSRNLPSTSSASNSNGVKNINVARNRLEDMFNAANTQRNDEYNLLSAIDDGVFAALNWPRPGTSGEPVAGGSRADQRLPVKRTNDQPQINTNAAVLEKVNKELGISRGAVKKRQAPQPPAPPPDARRDFAFYSAMRRQQDEEHQRREQSAINVAQGLPPVLSPAAKLERLRKMDALHNREAAPPRRPPVPPAPPAPPAQPPQDLRHEFRDIKPMNPEEFMRRFQALQVNGASGSGSRSNGEHNGNRPRSDGGRGEAGGRGDRFGEIKSSLMALRRGLNEVTAPYNYGNEAEINNGRAGIRPRSSSGSSDSSSEGSGCAAGVAGGGDVRLPCEFCARPILLDQLVIHQTGCRPDLAQLRTRDSPPANRQQQRQQHGHQQPPQRQQQQQQQNHNPPQPDELPVIPCEFCTESLPVYLISEHQERCRRDGPMLYPD